MGYLVLSWEGGGGGKDEFQRILSELSKDIIVKKGGG